MLKRLRTDLREVLLFLKDNQMLMFTSLFFSLISEYHDLYELQRKRLEGLVGKCNLQLQINIGTLLSWIHARPG